MLNIKSVTRGFIYGFIPGAVLSLFMYEALKNPTPFERSLILFGAISAGIFISMFMERKEKLCASVPFILFGQIFSGNYVINSLSLGMAVYYCLALIFSGEHKKEALNVLLAIMGFWGAFAALYKGF